MFIDSYYIFVIVLYKRSAVDESDEDIFGPSLVKNSRSFRTVVKGTDDSDGSVGMKKLQEVPKVADVQAEKLRWRLDFVFIYLFIYL